MDIPEQPLLRECLAALRRGSSWTGLYFLLWCIPLPFRQIIIHPLPPLQGLRILTTLAILRGTAVAPIGAAMIGTRTGEGAATRRVMTLPGPDEEAIEPESGRN
jgi:hypothetical protein